MRGGPTVLVFVKYPEPGRVKTRLAGRTSPEHAARLYRQWIGSVLGRLQPLRTTTRLVGYFDGAPREAFGDWHRLADDWWPQPEGDLGDRLVAGFEVGFDGDGGPVIAVGTDCLELEAEGITEAFEALSARDVVFGPAADGGYYLVGTSRARPSLFHSVRWSSPFTLADHLSRCRQEGWSVALLPCRHDIDTWDDWQAYLVRTGRSPEGELHDPGRGHSDLE
jgi:rSAM/selenodomain-associated transferase 1